MPDGTSPRPFEGLTEIREILRASLDGSVIEGAMGSPAETERAAGAAAATIAALAACGDESGFGALEVVVLKGAKRVAAAGARGDGLLLVDVDPARGTAAVEKALHAWATEPAGSAALPTVTPVPVAARPPAAQAPLDAPPVLPRTSAAGAAADPWSALRRALARGQLTEAAPLQRDLDLAPPAAAGRPGSEPLAAAERERALRVLLDGIGSVVIGDGIGAARTLRPLGDPAMPNLSLRWLALQWSAWAAIRSGAFPAARSYLREALLVSRQLDVHARAVTQWTAAEVLARDGDTDKALVWVAEARGRFQRLDDRWGVARTWLAEARTLAAVEREREAADAARKAHEFDAAWEDPPVFMATRALMRQDLAEAQEIVRPLHTPAADRVRALVEAVRGGAVSQADASAYLREQDAPPSARAVQELERIAAAAPGFAPAREALAWMLLKLGRYADASGIFRALLARPLASGDRASVMLGLGCIAHAQQNERRDEAAGTATGPAPRAAAPEAAGGVAPVFAGRLSVFALPDLLEFLRSTRRTGLLVCSSAAGMGSLEFRSGFITGAESATVPHVGEILHRAGQISADALRVVERAGAAGRSDRALAELLVRDGLADAAAVQGALGRAVELTVRELVQWKDGDFAFNPVDSADDASGPLSVELDAQSILLNCFKDMDEQGRDAAARANA